VKTPLYLIALCLGLLSSNTWGRIVLQNDSVQPGDQIAFYPNMGGGESFISIFDVPADYPDFQICRVLLWIGPAGSNIFTIRVSEADDQGDEAALIWQSDLDAYQIFGSREQLSAIDLVEQGIRGDARRLRVLMRHVEGQDAPPGIATDTDGITNGHNQLSVFLRNGSWFRGGSEELDEDGVPPRPPGDWILRVEIVGVDEGCPAGNAPLPDMGQPNPPQDAGTPPAPDAHLPLSDAGTPPSDGGMDSERQRPDAGPGPLDGGRVRADGSLTPMRDLELTRIAPVEGRRDRNTEVVVNGRGFPLDGRIFGEVGTSRLLELDVLSGSTMTAIVPAGLEPGAHDLRLTRGDGQVAILPGAFTVLGDSLALTAVGPPLIAQNRPAELSIDGQGFAAGVTFTVAGNLLENVTLDSAERARGTLYPSMPPGVYDLVARQGEDVARLQDAIEVVGAVDAGVGRSGAVDGGCTTGAAPFSQDSIIFLAMMGFVCCLRRRQA
jgi:hypothetical protein